jgi:Transcriptional regulator
MVHEAGLRQRKKQQTREALIDAALDLFLLQGYEHTTVDQIAAAAEVSPRTFFRYFGSKEELLSHYMSTAEDALIRALAERPAEEPPFTAAAEAYRAFFRSLEDASPQDKERFTKTRRVLAAEPALLGVQFTRMAGMEERLTAEMARRMGVDPIADERPRIVVAMVGAAVRAGLTRLPTGDGSREHAGDAVSDAVNKDVHEDVNKDAVSACVRQVDRAIDLARRLLGPDSGAS